MKHIRRTLWFPAAALLAALVLFTGTACALGPFSAEGSFERTLTVTGPVKLEVQTGSGDISVRAGEPGQVIVRGQIRARGTDAEEKIEQLEANPPIKQDGNTIRVGPIQDRNLRRNVSISYELIVPVDTRLEADTGSGDLTIAGIRGPVSADTGSGSIQLSNLGGNVTADTGSGDIELRTIEGNVSADTGSGSIRASGVAGAFSGDTGSGNVRLEQTAPGPVNVNIGSGSVELSGVRGPVKVSTGSGDITVQGEPAGNWSLSAGSGDIRLRLPQDAGFQLQARTSSGSVHSDHPLMVQGTVKRNELRGTVRGGGPEIIAHTGSGNIRIE
ncbi:DUF4097 domain-containing protein [Acidobacteriia bacterium AH_259_A11_L15]|nr:DUF4097 domain-containing protein [Acidobacteriia bacterium AH_259_A11_L15]